MLPTVTITETAAIGADLTARDVRDLAHVRRLLLQAALAVEGDDMGSKDLDVPVAKLHLLRGFLGSLGCGDRGKARRLLLMALLQLEDEDDAARFVMPHPVLPVITRNE